MMLYSFKGARPSSLPFRITLPNGFTRTDPSTFTDEEIASAGYIGPYAEPEYDPLTEDLVWDNGVFSVVAKPVKVPAPDYQGFYQALIASNVYRAVLSQPATAELARALAVFVSAIQDCMAGRESRKAMQGAIWMLLSQVTLSQENAVELQDLMRLYSLESVYVLQP